jgi:hypothetical protein
MTTSEPVEGRGMTIFAAVLLGVLGFFNLLDGIAAINRSHVFTGTTVYVVGDLRSWGWVMAILGGLQLLAAFGVAARNQAARWFGVLVIALNLIGQMFFIAAYPVWSLTIIAVDVIALCALCAFGGPEQTTT